jgi:phage portal protein BeeE
MDDYSYFNSQHSSVGLPPLYIKNNTMPFDNMVSRSSHEFYNQQNVY